MSNNNSDVLNNVIEKFGIERATDFCEILAIVYDIKYQAEKEQSPLTENDFERRWWSDAFRQLKKDVTI